MRPTSPRSFALVFALTLSIAGVRGASADDAPGSDAAMEKSSALYLKGRALHARAQWPEAEKLYQEAWDIRRTFDIAGNLGDCELHVGQPREAAAHLTYALKNFPAGGTAEQKQTLTDRLKEAKKQIATLHVSVNVEGAELLVNEHPLDAATTLDSIYVDPGPCTVEAKLTGYTPDKKALTVAAGDSQDVRLMLVRERRPLWPAFIGGGVAAVFLGGGVAFTVASNGARSDSTSAHQKIGASGKLCGHGADAATCTGLKSSLSSVDSSKGLAVAGYVGAGVAALATGAYLVWAKSTPAAPSKVAAVPFFTLDSAGLSILGKF
jgi:hypothetical protein